MKAKDFWSKIGTQGKFSENESFKKFIETLKDEDVPDDIIAEFENSFLTIERARTHEKVEPHIRRQFLDGLDSNIHESLTLFPAEIAREIGDTKDSWQKLKLFKKALVEQVERAKKENPNASDKEKEYKKNIEELSAKLENEKKAWENEKKTIADQHEAKIRDLNLDFALEKKTNSYTLAEAHEKLREPITKVILADLKGKHSLALGENGQILVNEIVNGVPKPKYNGNDPVTIDKLLDEAYSPYLKRNNSDNNNQDNNNSGGQQNRGTQRFQVDNNKSTHRQGSRTTVQS